MDTTRHRQLQVLLLDSSQLFKLDLAGVATAVAHFFDGVDRRQEIRRACIQDPVDTDRRTCGRDGRRVDWRREVEGILANMPTECVVHVREGGGPEDILASLAVSVSKLSTKYIFGKGSK